MPRRLLGARFSRMFFKNTAWFLLLLDLGDVGVVRKFQALCHAFWLETINPRLLKQCLESVYWITSDLGAEAQLTDVPPTLFQELVGSYIELPDFVCDDISACTQDWLQTHANPSPQTPLQQHSKKIAVSLSSKFKPFFVFFRPVCFSRSVQNWTPRTIGLLSQSMISRHLKLPSPSYVT